MNTILSIENLTIAFCKNKREHIAVDNISFVLQEGEFFALAGESGSGKTATALALLNLIESPGSIKNGAILFQNRNLLVLSQKELNHIRGKEMSMIFQEPSAAFDHFFTVGQQFIEIIKWHLKMPPKKAKESVLQWLSLIGFKNPPLIYNSYPFQLSGGMQQRVMIAMALCCNPAILIADEPTSSLDSLSQNHILDLLAALKKNMHLTILLISHDFGIIAQFADRIAIMFRGKIMEVAPKYELFNNPAHPYTIMLFNSIPDFKTQSFPAHPQISSPAEEQDSAKTACPFYYNCAVHTDECTHVFPQATSLSPEHLVYCWHLK
ncbi:MAG: hypothetical protein A2Y62_21155 [Candidatus Fischerbacteria bacterium RBG_13_37_8]|uniref:ABC transporter domain-containing protein n=1 Tax=Candidatus Fischerbacteria bacterium RBG_13_37_8 TaxID=1817863 RepID=A0A1F5V6H7_9BACT|nr:MAG: hypothetical protein A2Y62_21155 [Candidatus Fischerbacteria bacterium RBG_13_37_8]